MIIAFPHRLRHVFHMTYVYLAGTVTSLMGGFWLLMRAVTVLQMISQRINDLASAFLGAFNEVPEAELRARLIEQDAKIDRLTTGWVDFLDKQTRLEARISGAKGGRPKGSGHRRVEEEVPDPVDDDDAPPRPEQGLLPLRNGVEGGGGPRPLEFAPLPPFRMR